MSSSAGGANLLGKALIDYASNGQFPEEEVSAAVIESSTLPVAIVALSQAKTALQTEIRQLSRESAPDVDAWIKNAQTLQEDIEKSKKLAADIVRQAEADDARAAAIADKELHVDFLQAEIAFNAQLVETLNAIKRANDSLDETIRLATEDRIAAALESLQGSAGCIGEIKAESKVRAIRLLNARYAETREIIYERVRSIWNSLLHIDAAQRTFTVSNSYNGSPTTLADVTVGLSAYNDLEKAGKELWNGINRVIVQPRIDLRTTKLASIDIQEQSLVVTDRKADYSINSLLSDVENIIQFFVRNLPQTLVAVLANVMMPSISAQIKDTWLDAAVPVSLDAMGDYQKALAQVHAFTEKLRPLNWPGTDDFESWVVGAPKIWLNKKRETSLDWVRNELSQGIGKVRKAQRVEQRMVPVYTDGLDYPVQSNETKPADEWGWGDDEEEAPKDEITGKGTSIKEDKADPKAPPPLEDIDAWGWGDEDAAAEAESLAESDEPAPQLQVVADPPPSTRLETLTEQYHTSSMPNTVLQVITEIYDEGAKLTGEVENPSPVAAAAGGLFNLPTLILAMYRAISPYYYALDAKGNMYSYNDAMWLSDQLRSFTADWANRTDLAPRAINLVKLTPEIKALESFGRRAYRNEMNTQRITINDLLGSPQNFLQQESSMGGELEGVVDGINDYIKEMARSWKEILTYSSWASAVGTLLNTVASKIIADVFDLSDMGVDDAERTAKLITQVTTLDELFLSATCPHPEAPKLKVAAELEEQPATAQYADKWLKLHFLCQVLQSGLKDIRFLWFESELSYFFSKEEVVDLIELSFENNAAVRQMIRDVKEKPLPMLR